GSLGFLSLLAVSCLAIAGRSPRSQLLGDVALPVVPALVMGVTGGFSWVIALSGFTEIRAWNRISVFLAFFSFAAVGYGLDRMLEAGTRRGWTTALAPVVAAMVLVVGLFDQTSSAIVPDSRR